MRLSDENIDKCRAMKCKWVLHATPAGHCRPAACSMPATAPALLAPTCCPTRSQQEESEGLLPEEDPEIPGTYRDAMTTNTQLGKAVKGACDELDTLGELVSVLPARLLARHSPPLPTAAPCLCSGPL